MKILLFCHLGQIPEFAEYINALKKVSSIQTLFLTMGREEYERGQEVGVFDVVKDVLPKQSELDASDKEASRIAQALSELEERIGSNFVNRDIMMDRFFTGPPRLDVDPNKVPLIWAGSRAKHFMYLFYKQLEKEITSFEPDFIFIETHLAPNRMIWRLAREKGIPAGRFSPVRFWPERLYLETEIGYEWHQVRTAYSEMPNRPMKGAELAKVKQRLQTILDEKTKPVYMQSEHAKGAPDILKRLHPAQLITQFNSWLGTRARSSTTNPQILPSKVFSPISKLIRYRDGMKAKRYLLQNQIPFEQIRGKKYEIYFLHVQPELTVEGMAFDYRDQVNTLNNILAALPADMYLVVKEHTPMLGFRPLAIYKHLVRIPGIIIADTNEDSHNLITHASTVITLTGTVALEAVLYGIPAIVLGSIYFEGFNGVYKPENLDELRQLLSDPNQLVGATKDDALRALGSMLRASDLGSPPRVDPTKLQQIDAESAKVMMSKLELFGE
jgi:hypothetical protein